VASTPTRKLRFSLENALDGCPRVDYVCGCFAGLLTEEDRAHAEEQLRGFFPRAAIKATPDYAAALYASDEGTDLVVIAGTGSLVCSREANGEIVRSGGRGYILGDYGSAYRYGKAALQHYLQDRVGASEDLRCAVLKLFGNDDERQILSRVYRQGSPPATLAKLSKALAQDATSGFEYARQTVEEQTAKLADITAEHIGHHLIGHNRLGLCLAGGLWQTAGIYREIFIAELTKRVKGVELEFHKIKNPPVIGAVRLAQEMASGH